MIGTVPKRLLGQCLRANSTSATRNAVVSGSQVLPGLSNTSSINSYLNSYKQTFPKDTITVSYINSYKRLNSFPPGQPGSAVNIGILYADDAKQSSFIDVLLADPLSEGNKKWFTPVEQRSRSVNNEFSFIPRDEYKGIDTPGRFLIPSPILSADFRPSFSTVLSRVSSNNIRLFEVNDENEQDFSQIDFFIRICSNFKNVSHETDGKILLNIIDNADYTPRSTSSTNITFDLSNDDSHTIKVDSIKALAGIKKFQEFDVEASTEYIQAVQDSNFNEVAKALTWYSDIQNINRYLLASITRRLKNSSSVESLSRVRQQIETNDIVDFNNTVHTELQQVFIPITKSYFRRNLKWWQLYYKNDNVEYDVKQFLSQNFLNSSIEKYTYLKGQIDNKLSSSVETGVEKVNPLAQLKDDVINNRVPNELQPYVNKVLIEAFVYYQLPISIISALAYQIFDFEVNSVVALALLGWTVGFNHVSKNWNKEVNSWLNGLFEDARICLTRKCVDEGLLLQLNEKYSEELKNVQLRKDIVKGIN